MKVSMTALIEKDGVYDGRYMIVILDGIQTVGIPVRNVTLKQATIMLPSIKSAFEYGYKRALLNAEGVIARASYSFRWEEKEMDSAGLLHDCPHKEPGKARAAKVVRACKQ